MRSRATTVATTIAVPTTASRIKWLAVATTASTMRIGIATAKARTARRLLARKIAMPSRTFQPAWKLGIAAYWLTSEAGRIAR